MFRVTIHYRVNKKDLCTEFYVENKFLTSDYMTMKLADFTKYTLEEIQIVKCIKDIDEVFNQIENHRIANE